MKKRIWVMNVDILSFSEIKANLADKRLYKVSEATGLSYPTLKKLANGDNCNYTMSTMRAVSEYINKHKLKPNPEDKNK